MKRVIKSAMYMGSKYRYEVRWLSLDNEDCLLGGSNFMSGAANIARNQLKNLEDSPFMDNIEKVLFIKSLYIYDSEEDDVVKDVEVEKYRDKLLVSLRRNGA